MSWDQNATTPVGSGSLKYGTKRAGWLRAYKAFAGRHRPLFYIDDGTTDLHLSSTNSWKLDRMLQHRLIPITTSPNPKDTAIFFFFLVSINLRRILHDAHKANLNLLQNDYKCPYTSSCHSVYNTNRLLLVTGGRCTDCSTSSRQPVFRHNGNEM